MWKLSNYYYYLKTENKLSLECFCTLINQHTIIKYIILLVLCFSHMQLSQYTETCVLKYVLTEVDGIWMENVQIPLSLCSWCSNQLQFLWICPLHTWDVANLSCDELLNVTVFYMDTVWRLKMHSCTYLFTRWFTSSPAKIKQWPLQLFQMLGISYIPFFEPVKQGATAFHLLTGEESCTDVRVNK